MATLAPHNSAIASLIVAIEVTIREAVAHAIATRDPTGGELVVGSSWWSWWSWWCWWCWWCMVVSDVSGKWWWWLTNLRGLWRDTCGETCETWLMMGVWRAVRDGWSLMVNDSGYHMLLLSSCPTMFLTIDATGRVTSHDESSYRPRGRNGHPPPRSGWSPDSWDWLKGPGPRCSNLLGASYPARGGWWPPGYLLPELRSRGTPKTGRFWASKRWV